MAEETATDDTLLIEAGRFLAQHQSFGLAWIDPSLVVRKRFGSIVDFVTVDRPLTDSVIALIGCEDEIAALRDGEDRGPLIIPNVVMYLDAARPRRLSIDVYWSVEQNCYLMLARNVVDDSALEAELRTQTRLRAIAEAEVVEKSRAIQRANLELALANRDLEEFTYAISHDLKAPLRALRYDSGDANRDLAAGDLEGVRNKLTAMQGHQSRMVAMLDGLFDYARAGRKTEGIAMVDTRQLVDEVVAGLVPRDGIIVAIEGSWPHLMTLAPPFALVLRNLIDNSIKHHDRPDGRITLVGRIAEDTLDITISDDGPGIPLSWQTAVFLPFRKVNEEDGSHEGSGMGLALVRRTLDRIGGSIELHSDAPRQRGSIFKIRWPKRIVV